MLALTPAYPFRPAGSRAISLIHVSQISGDHRQDEGRKRLPGATNAGHIQKGPMTRKIIPLRRSRPAIAAAHDHTTDAVAYLHDRAPDLDRIQYHIREADRLIQLYRGNRAA